MRSLIGCVEYGGLSRIGVCDFGLDIAAIIAGATVAGTTAGAVAAPTAAAVAPALAAGLSTVASLASVGVGVEQATKGAPKPPTTPAEHSAKLQEAARRRGILSQQTGRQSTITTGAGNVGSGSLGKSTLGAGL